MPSTYLRVAGRRRGVGSRRPSLVVVVVCVCVGGVLRRTGGE